MKGISFKDFVSDQLRDLGHVTFRSMFGGHGLYYGDMADKAFFGIVFKGRLYFKTDSTTAARYVQRGMKPFKPGPRQTLKSFYEVPVEILEDAEDLVSWTREAVHISRKKTR
ncbi:MAG: TfoX/Sxy family protein [Nitrospirae bacterium]|nr:TfoX/Sxy family protein [Nitrospirota bacterium]